MSFINLSTIANREYAEQIASRMRSAIVECEAFIAKESMRRADLRPAGMQECLDLYRVHMENMRASLETLH